MFRGVTRDELIMRVSKSQFRKVRYQLPLRSLLVVAFLVQSVTAVGLTGWLSLRNGQRAVNNVANQLLDEVSTNIQQHLQDYLQTHNQINQITIDLIQNNRINIDKLSDTGAMLWQQHQWFRSVDLIALGLEDTGNYVEVSRGRDGIYQLSILDRSVTSDFLTYSLDAQGLPARLLRDASSYDPRQRPWYKDAVEAGQAVWNDVYITQFDQKLVIATSQPIYDKSNNLIGVATTNTGLFQINQFLRKLKIGRSGQTFIVEPNGMLIASSTSEEPYLPRNDGSPERIRAAQSWNPLVKATAEYLDTTFNNLQQVSGRQQLYFKFAQMRHFVRVLPFQDQRGLDWLIVVVVPEADFTAQIRANTNITIALCFIVFGLSAGIGIATSKWLIDPILNVAKAADALSKGQWFQKVPEFASRELSLLARTFNQMAEQLQVAFQTLQEAEAKYRDIFENAIEGIYQSTPDGYYLSVNPALANMYGYPSPQELVEKITNIALQVYIHPNRRADFIQLLENNDSISGFESQIYRADGTTIWISENARAKRDENGNVLYYEGTVEDITQRKQIEAQLTYNACHDSLTGLLNRASFLERLQKVILLSRGKPNHLFAVLFLDLDDFKRVNDSLGHLVGDRLLIAFVQRICAKCLRDYDIIARFGGDEFIVLLDRLANPEEAIRIVQDIYQALQSPFHLTEDEVFIGTSIGIVLSTTSDEMQAEDFLRDADIALYEAKLKGKGCYQLFDAQMHFQVIERLQLENDLRRGLGRNEFVIYYQPIFHLKTHQVIGFEALARWFHPEKGFLFPSKFIPLAEETGLIVQLGQFVMRTACQQLKQWQQQGLVDDQVTMSVNVAGRQFAQSDLVNDVQSILRAVKLPAKSLRVEVTEGIIMENETIVIDTLAKLKQIGVDVAIDDFGIGYSSLSRLQNFPVGTLKLDRAFINKMSETPEHKNFVRAIIHLARTLKVTIISEGIETEWQKEQLRTFGCHYGQGFWFSEPLDHQSVPNLLKKSYLNCQSGQPDIPNYLKASTFDECV